MDTDVRHPAAAAMIDQPASPYRRYLKPVVVVVVLALILAAIWTVRHPGPGASGQMSGPASGAPSRPGQRGQFATTVGTALAQQQEIPITLDALGTVTPTATAVVRAQVSGVVTQVLYSEGQLVKRGQVLALIDPAPFQLALNQALGNLQRDAAQLQLAKVNLERALTLLAQDSIAQQDVDTQQASVKQLEGVVATDQANVDSARLDLNYARIVAPIDGRIGLRPVDVGNYITPSDSTGVATITKLAPTDVVFAVPSDAIARIQSRLASGATLTATVMDRTKTTTLAQGSFLTLDNQVDVQTGTVRAKARFANKDEQLFANQFVNVRLLTDTLKAAIVIPTAAVRHGPQGDFVYLVTADSKAKVQAITTGAASADLISVSSGLKTGDRVITEGGDRLTDGATVKLPDTLSEHNTAQRKQRAAAQ